MADDTTLRAARSARLYKLLAWAWVALVAALLIPRVLVFWEISAGFVAWPWQFDFTEGVNLNATQQLAAGQNIYLPSDPGSFTSAPYTPVFFLLNLPFAWLFGPTLTSGRVISLLATLTVAVLLVYLVGRASRQWLAGLAAAAMWLSLSPVIVWSALYTQHIVALAFGMAGLTWVALHPRSRHFYIGPLLFTLAFYTKQSALDAAAAAALWLLFVNRRHGLRFVLTLMGAISAPLALAVFFTRGGFWEHIVTNQGVLTWSERRFRRLLDRLLGEYWPLLGWGAGCVLTAGGALAASWRKKLPPDSRGTGSTIRGVWSLVLLYSLFASASVLVRLGRQGVNYNHYIDVLLPACLLLGLSLGTAVTALLASVARRRVHWPLWAGVVLGAGLIVWAQLFQFTDPHTWYAGLWPSAVVDKQMQALSAQVRGAPGDVFSEDAYLLLSNGHRAVYDDDFMFMSLARIGQWDERIFDQSLRDRRFSLVLLQTGSTRFSEPASAAFDANYAIKSQGGFDLYVPKPVPDAPQYSQTCGFWGNGDMITLLGYSLPPGVAWNGAGRGSALHVTLYWEPANKVQGDYAGYVQLLNAQGEKVVSQDNPHTGAGRPTNTWVAGETVKDTAALPIPPTLAPGAYTLIAGMYRFEAGKLTSLEPTCAHAGPFSPSFTLGTVVVK